MKIVRRRHYPRPPKPTAQERNDVFALFDHGDQAEIDAYIATETAKVRAKWDRLDELRRRGITADEEQHVEIVDFVSGFSRRHVARAEY